MPSCASGCGRPAGPIDKQQIADVVFQGAAIPADTFISPDKVFWHLDIPADQEYDFNLDEANQILELTPLDDVMVAGGIAEDMELLGQLLEQAEGLSYDVGALETQIASLFALDTAPDTRDGLTERMAEIKRVKFQSYRYAAKVQTLLSTAARTIEHLTGLLDTVGALIGNMQANQTHAQFQSVLGKHMANLEVQQAAFQRAQTVDKLSEAVIIESINRIQARRMEDWPEP